MPADAMLLILCLFLVVIAVVVILQSSKPGWGERDSRGDVRRDYLDFHHEEEGGLEYEQRATMRSARERFAHRAG